MTICFSLAQDHLVSPRYQTLALKEFAFADSYDKGDDQSNGAVWQAGLEGLEPQLSPSLSKVGVWFLISSFWGVPPKYELGQDAASFQSYEGLFNGQRYTIIFGRRVDYTWKDAAAMASQFLPLQVLRRKEFTAVMRNIGVKAISDTPSVPQSQGGGGSSWINYDVATVVPKPISTGSSSLANRSRPGRANIHSNSSTSISADEKADQRLGPCTVPAAGRLRRPRDRIARRRGDGGPGVDACYRDRPGLKMPGLACRAAISVPRFAPPSWP
jgi:hypothetical protein